MRNNSFGCYTHIVDARKISEKPTNFTLHPSSPHPVNYYFLEQLTLSWKTFPLRRITRHIYWNECLRRWRSSYLHQIYFISFYLWHRLVYVVCRNKMAVIFCFSICLFMAVEWQKHFFHILYRLVDSLYSSKFILLGVAFVHICYWFDSSVSRSDFIFGRNIQNKTYFAYESLSVFFVGMNEAKLKFAKWKTINISMEKPTIVLSSKSFESASYSLEI